MTDRPVSDAPFVVLLEKDRVDQADDGVLVGEDAVAPESSHAPQSSGRLHAPALARNSDRVLGRHHNKVERWPWPGATPMAPMTSSRRRGIGRRARSQSTCAGRVEIRTFADLSLCPLLELRAPSRRKAGGCHATLRHPLLRHLARRPAPPPQIGPAQSLCAKLYQWPWFSLRSR